MLSLRNLLAAHAPLLVIDAASVRIHIGLFSADGTGRWAALDEEAGVAIFRGIEQLGVDLAGVRAFAFCEGPGSTLGIRTAAMALRTWDVLAPRPAFAYGSLAVIADALDVREGGVIADARRDSWHYQTRGEPLRRIPTAELTGRLLTPAPFRHWTPLPAGVELTPYEPADLLHRTIDNPLFRSAPAPDAFQHDEPSYATWTPKIHRPTPS
jgi:tRNA threonylcarbamoyladenosine biosynthesis protein TsaB